MNKGNITQSKTAYTKHKREIESAPHNPQGRGRWNGDMETYFEFFQHQLGVFRPVSALEVHLALKGISINASLIYGYLAEYRTRKLTTSSSGMG